MSALPEDFPVLLEKAIDWASDLEAQVLESGEELESNELLDARLAGVKEPARIRVLVVEEIPVPSDAALRAANDRVHLVSPDGLGLTLGYAVVVRAGHEHERRLLVHEFVHVAQYERLGGITRFLRAYLTDVLQQGYERSAFEAEAKLRTNLIVGNS